MWHLHSQGHVFDIAVQVTSGRERFTCIRNKGAVIAEEAVDCRHLEYSPERSHGDIALLTRNGADKESIAAAD